MPVGTSLGTFFEDDLQHQLGIDRTPNKADALAPTSKESRDDNVVTPDRADQAKQKDKIELSPDLGGMPISDKGTITVRSLNGYDTPLTPEEQSSYDTKYGPDATRDYDMQGYHKANPEVDHAEGQHYPDTYKKPNHPTFSDESIYHGQDGNEGGHWGQEDGKDTFTPGATNMQNWGREGLQRYFRDIEPDVKLKMPLPDLTNKSGLSQLGDDLFGTGKNDIRPALMGAVTGIKNALSLPGDVFSGKVKAGSQEEINRSADLAGLMVGGPAPVAAKMADGTLGSFAGVGSKTINKDILKVAEEAEAKGAHPDDIWEQTGFFKGADGKWRYEIPDDKAAINTDVTKKTYESKTGDSTWDVYGLKDEEHKLPDVLHHPELYKAYPELKDINVKPVPPLWMLQGIQGGFAKDINTLYLGSGSLEKMRSTMMHELQHSIQEREGFYPGSNAQRFVSPELKSMMGEANKLSEQYQKEAIDLINSNPKIADTYKNVPQPPDTDPKGWQTESPYFDPDKWDGPKRVFSTLSRMVRAEKHGILSEHAENLLKTIEGDHPEVINKVRSIEDSKSVVADKQDQLLELYRRVYGEVESRNVQSRLKMENLDRYGTPPRSTEDRPRFVQLHDPGTNISGPMTSEEPTQIRRGANDNQSSKEFVSKFMEDLPTYGTPEAIDIKRLREYLDKIQTPDK